MPQVTRLRVVCAAVAAGALTLGTLATATAAQAPETAQKWFAGRDDLTLVAIDADQPPDSVTAAIQAGLSRLSLQEARTHD